MLKISFGVAKVNKYASRESGDTFELVERPAGMGGLTGVLVDGQSSGRTAKSLSNLIAGHCVSLLKQGVRDGVVARAANDLLYNHREGRVSATLNLLSADLATRSLVITRNNPHPVFVGDLSGAVPEIITLAEPCEVLGSYPRTRPIIREFELKAGLVAVAFTDGLATAGTRYGQEPLDLAAYLAGRVRQGFEAQPLADDLLALALQADRNFPKDDTSVMVLAVHNLAVADGTVVPRRMWAEMAVEEATRATGL